MPTSSKSTTLRGEVKTALARWALRRRLGTGAERPSEDEATHPWDGRRRFEEDYTFAAVQAELALVVRLARLPGRDAQRLWVWVLTPTGVWGHQSLWPAHAGEPWQAGGLVLDCLAPFRAWSLHFAGSLAAFDSAVDKVPKTVTLEATFTAELPPFSPGADDDPWLLARRLSEATWDRGLLRGVRRAQTRGYVQAGRLEGTLRVGDRLIPVHAPCWRQHRWGVLDWGGSDDAFQCFLADPGGGVTWLHRARFPFVTLEGGFVASPDEAATPWSDRRVIPVTSLERPAPWELTVGHPKIPAGVEHLTLRPRAQATFTVDGRGALELALVDTEQGGWGIWATQRRSLARPER